MARPPIDGVRSGRTIGELVISSLWRRAISVAAILAMAVSASAAQDLHIGPDFYSGRHATYLTIVVFRPGPGRPPINLFARRDVRGTPDVVIDRRGLVEGGVVKCIWWNPESLDGSSGLPLKRTTPSTRPEDPCADGISTDRFTFGPPRLHILVRRVRGTIAEIPYDNKTLYLDLNTLPGDPNDENAEGPRVRVRRKGAVGWEWLDSQQTEDRRVRRYLATLLKDPTFADFYRNLQRCLRTSNPECLTPFLAKDFSFQPPDRDDVLTRETFAEYGWTDVANCFLDGRPDDATPPTFTHEFFACRLGPEGGGYVIAACDVTE